MQCGWNNTAHTAYLDVLCSDFSLPAAAAPSLPPASPTLPVAMVKPPIPPPKKEEWGPLPGLL